MGSIFLSWIVKAHNYMQFKIPHNVHIFEMKLMMMMMMIMIMIMMMMDRLYQFLHVYVCLKIKMT